MKHRSKSDVDRLVQDYLKQQLVAKVQRPPLPSERAAENFAADWMRSTGFDTKAAYAIQRRHRAEWDHMVPTQSASAAKRWAGRIKQTQAAVTAQTKGLLAPDFFPSRSFTLDKANAIVRRGKFSIISSDTTPLINSAKVRLDRTEGATDTVGFRFDFQNPFPTPVIFDFLTNFSASGHLALRQNGHFPATFSEADLQATLEVLPLNRASERLSELINVSVPPPPFYWIDHTVEKPFSNSASLAVRKVTVGGGQTVPVLVSLEVDSDFDGHLIADLSSGTFGIQCPAVIVVLTAIPVGD
jgi:hypothetical protein